MITLQGPISDDLIVSVNLLADGTPIMISGLRRTGCACVENVFKLGNSPLVPAFRDSLCTLPVQV